MEEVSNNFLSPNNYRDYGYWDDDDYQDYDNRDYEPDYWEYWPDY